MSDIRVVFSGAHGRMGRALCPGLDAAEGIALVARVDVDDDLVGAVRDNDATVVVDFTTPAAAVANARKIIEAGAHGVIGTTGFTTEDLDALDREAQAAERNLIIAPNFSLGMLLLQRFADEAVRYFPRVEIVETHHEGKLDAPSGTAQRTAERLAARGARSGPDSSDAARGLDVDGVRVHSMRLANVEARQTVHFGGADEGLMLQHEANSRACYLPGVIAAIRAAGQRSGVTRGLEPVVFGDA